MDKKYVDLQGNAVEVPPELKSMRLLAGTELEGVDKEEYFIYLDLLRKSGVTNIFGALQGAFGLDWEEARAILIEWMETFDERHPE